MTNKNFVSLYFLPNKLQLVYLHNKTRKALKIASVNLPDGIIETVNPEGIESSYKVKNPALLAQIIHSTWIKLHLKEKSVGIVIPEFATYTKLLTIPNVGLGELDEAVRWQAQEYFPAYAGSDSSPTKLNMDWKIAEKTDKGYEVVVVMVGKDLLQGYINACEIAGLFPLIVSTPSLVLSGIGANEDSNGRLVIYNGIHESILTAVKEQKIIGTAIIPTPDDAEVEKTAKRIISHYHQFDIKTVYCGGAGFTKEKMEDLGKALNKTVQTLSPNVIGLAEEGVQDYLIPIALQYNEIYEPSDHRTVNLLPSGLVIKYRAAQMRLRMWGLTLTVSLLTWLCVISTLGAFLFLSQQIAEYENKNVSINAIIAQNKAVTEKIKNINKTVEKIGKIQQSIVYPDKIFRDIDSAKPSGISITSYKMDLDTGIIRVRGKATDRSSLIQFQDNLEKNSNIQDIIIPMSNLEVEKDLSFDLTYTYTKAATPTGKPKALPRSSIEEGGLKP